MPGISGFTIIDILATNEILKDQNIFIFSATPFESIQIKDLLRKDGINGCLKKPIQLNEILTAITSRGFFLTRYRLKQFLSFPKNNFKIPKGELAK